MAFIPLKMNILSYSDVEKYIQNKQVYFRKSIEAVDFKTLAKENKVYYSEKRTNSCTLYFFATLKQILLLMFSVVNFKYFTISFVKFIRLLLSLIKRYWFNNSAIFSGVIPSVSTYHQALHPNCYKIFWHQGYH